MNSWLWRHATSLAANNLALASALLGVMGAAACSPAFDKTLPPSSTLGAPRGYRIARTIIHLHTPYSWDGCDKNGLNADGVTPNEACLSQLRAALCKNRVDFALLSDHPDNMHKFEFPQLLLNQSGDQLITSGADTIANQLQCQESDSSPIVTVGFEDQLMSTMMTKHPSATQAARYTDYTGTATAAQVTNLKTAAGAVVFVPHTESREVSAIQALGVDGIEVYNLHANLDPKIRSTYLGLDHFDGVMDILSYWLDPYQGQEPDLAFVSFLRIAEVYMTKWNTLIGQGQQLMGIAGSDSHQNVFAYMARDGERLDSHRRLLRWFSNHVLVSDMSYASLKSALQNKRSWIAFEGLGTPYGMDFYAQTGTTQVGPGGTMTMVSGQTTITVKLPSLHSASPTDGAHPLIKIRLRRPQADGTAPIVAETINTDLNYTVWQTGAYRAEIVMIPFHLSGFLGHARNQLAKEMPWIITNHLYIN